MKNNISIFKSIRFKIFIWCLSISILPVIYISYTDYVEYEKKLKTATFNEIKQASNLKMKFIDNWFSYRYIDISTWSRLKVNIDLLEDISNLHKKSNLKLQNFVKSDKYDTLIKKQEDTLILFAQKYDYIYDLFLIDLDGNILFNVTKENGLGYSLNDDRYKDTKFSTIVNKTIKDNKLYFSDLERFIPSSDLISAFMTAPLIDENGKKIGVFAMQFNFDKIFDIFDGDVGNTQALYYLVGQDGYLRSKINSRDEILNEKVTLNNKQYNNWIEEHVKNSFIHFNSDMHSVFDEKFIEYVNVNKDTVYGMHQHINLLNVNWSLLSEINTDSFQIAKKNYLFNSILFLILLTFIIAIVAYFVSIAITKPIDILLDAINDYRSGNRDIGIKSDSKSEIGILGDSFDKMIKSLSKNESELLNKTKLAQEAARSKAEFLASMSHEIRTPMNGVIGMLNLLNNTKLNKSQRHHIYLALSSATALLGLINDILDFSKIEADKLELDIHEFNIRHELGDLVEPITLNAQEKGVELILDLSALKYDVIEADGDRIRQIITNIVGNSIKFTKQGYILIEVSLHDSLNKEARLNIKVTDTGIGIPKDKINKLFDSFTQVDASTTKQFGGTGLGLSIVKKLCELMDGEVKVVSEFGSGSTFECNIAVKVNSKDKITLEKKNLKEKSILIADYLTQSINSIKNELNSWNINIEYSRTFDETLLAVENDFFDVVLIDMKILDYGIQKSIKDLREASKNENIKLIMMMPISFDLDTVSSSDGYFSKPITTKDYLYIFDLFSQTKDKKIFQQEVKQIIKWPNNTKILIVEDNLTNQIIAKGMLEEIGLFPSIANDGAEAVEMIKNTKEPYTLILMDCQMPVMDGYEATRNIRNGYAGEKNKDITIVAMTANAMAGDKEKCLNNGMDDYITKPIDIKIFNTTLIQWLSPDEYVEEDIIESVCEQNPLVWDEENLFLRLGGSKDLMQKVIKIFLEDISKLSDNLKIAMKEDKKEDIKFYSHTIKGSAANLSAFKLQNVSQRIEHNLGGDYYEFISEVNELVAIFNKYIEKDIKTKEIQINGVYDEDLFISSLKELKLLLEYGSFINTKEMWIFSLKLNTEVDSQLSQLHNEINHFNSIDSIEIINTILNNIIDA